VKTLILGLAIILAGVVVSAPGPSPRVPQPLTGPPGGPHPPCCKAVSNDPGTDHVSAHSGK